MSRIKVLRANPRRALAALATVLVAVGVTVASGASFTAQTANAGNVFTAGTLTMSNSKGAGAILTASNMKPGDATTNATGTVIIKNTGSLAGTFKLTRTALSSSDGTYPMANKLNMTVTDCGADQDCTLTTDNSNVYTGTLAAMTSVITLGTPWAVNAQHTYQFVASLDSSADDNYQGDNASATFQWDAS